MIVEVLEGFPLGIKSVMVFIMKSCNHHMAVAVSHAVCVRQAFSYMDRKMTKKDSFRERRERRAVCSNFMQKDFNYFYPVQSGLHQLHLISHWWAAGQYTLVTPQNHLNMYKIWRLLSLKNFTGFSSLLCATLSCSEALWGWSVRCISFHLFSRTTHIDQYKCKCASVS